MLVELEQSREQIDFLSNLPHSGCHYMCDLFCLSSQQPGKVSTLTEREYEFLSSPVRAAGPVMRVMTR